jgi:alpha-mannosidase
MLISFRNSAHFERVLARLLIFGLALGVTVLFPLARPLKAQSGAGTPPAAAKPGAAQAKAPESKAAATRETHPDLTKQPTLYVVAYAHLDTQWRWQYPQTIDEYLSKTMRSNFDLFEKYPHYIFNFTGANRFMMMKEYFPADFARLKHYAAAGRWFPAGSSVEENDVNSPNAESIIRQVLYGNEFFRHEFGVASAEYMLPDCFGFPASLPSILAHAGMKGFSTQKLNAGWQPAARVGGPDSPEKTPEGIPFNVGVWIGPDGKSIIAALNPGDYTGQAFTDLSKNNPRPAVNTANSDYVWDWPDRLDIDGKLTGVYADYHYVGTGDIGGAPNENSVKLMEAIMDKAVTTLPPLPRRGQQNTAPPAPGSPVKVGDGPVHVMWSRADQMFLDIKPGETSRMPTYQGDLELINHSAGSISSQAYHKRWNRENELLANAAEEASVGAEWLGGRAYPQQRLTNAWRLVLGGQFHDIMAGTATPQSYNYSWNDDVIAMNQFAQVITSATEAIASGMNTEGKGTSIVVYNPLNIHRQDVAEAAISFEGGTPKGVRVTGADGKEVPAQVEEGENGSAKVLFLADVPSVGYAVYDVQPGSASAASASTLKVSQNSLENDRYRIQVDPQGDMSSLFDKKLNRELLSAPIRLAIITDNPARWPAWNMDFEDERRPPRSYVGGDATMRVVENGPARVAVEVSREAEGSKFVQTIRLSAGDAGNRVEFSNVIDWHTQEGNLKATFPFAASNKMATYNWDIGTIQRPNEDERQFEVASHQWIDLTDQGGAYGVTVLTDDKNASDKPADNTLRLTLVRTPGTRGGYDDQGSQDLGHHEFVYGLAAHDGDWRQGNTDWQAYRLNQPLMAFESPRHAGALGKELSLLKVDNERIRVLAMKKAEESNEVVVRLVETAGKPESNVHIKFAGAVLAAREVNGQEMPIGAATVEHGEVVTSFTAYQPRSFAVKLAASSKVAGPQSRPVTLNYDAAVATPDGKPAEGGFDVDLNAPSAPQGQALPAEMLPRDVDYGGIHFMLAPAGTGKPDAMTARGQIINLPAGKFNRVYILAASYQPQRDDQDEARAAAMDDTRATFRVGDQPVEMTVENWTGYIGQWDNRNWDTKEIQVPIRRAADAPPLPPGAPVTRTEKEMEFNGTITPGFIKRAPVAWYASHIHDSAGANEAYVYCYLFAYGLDVPEGVHTLTVPDNPKIRIMAVSVADEPYVVRPAQPLYDTLDRHGDQ